MLRHCVDGVESLIAHGADKVYLVDSRTGNQFRRSIDRTADRLIRQYKPEIVLRERQRSAGRLFQESGGTQHRSDSGLHRTGIDLEKRLLVRPATSAAIDGHHHLSGYRLKCPRQTRVFKKSVPDAARNGQIIKIDFAKEGITSRTRLLSLSRTSPRESSWTSGYHRVRRTRSGKAREFQGH